MLVEPFTPQMLTLAQDILALSAIDRSLEEIVLQMVMRIQKVMDIEAVGLRLAEPPDYPYCFTRGFSPDFVEKENYLCARDTAGALIRDPSGTPVLECMCGTVISGRTNAVYPHFTRGGSFWTNGTTALLSAASQQELQGRTRNRCNREGYESVALIPIRTEGRIHGLVQLNDRRENRFTMEEIVLFEWIAASIGILFLAIRGRSPPELLR